MQNKEVTKGEWKQFFFLLLLVVIFFICFIILLFKQKEQPAQKEKSGFSVKDTEYGFIYYNGDVYYKQPDMAIYDLSDVGESIGKNEKHLKVDDVNDGKVVFDDEKLCVFAEPIDTEVFSYKKNDDILLINSDYAINTYFVYLKDKTKEEESYKTLSYYIENPEQAAKPMLISYGMNIIYDNFEINSLEKNDSNYTVSGSIQNGKMVYYLFVEDEGAYRLFKGEGNVLSDTIMFESAKDGIVETYLFKKDGLSDKLIEMYSDFFGFNKQENKE